MLTIDNIRSSSDATIFLKDVASVLHVDVRTASSQLSVNGGDIPSMRVGGRRLIIPRERFLAWFDATGDEQRPIEAAPLTHMDAGAVAAVRSKLLAALVDLDAITKEAVA